MSETNKGEHKLLPAPKVQAFLLEGKVTQQESDQIDKLSTWETGAGGSEV